MKHRPKHLPALPPHVRAVVDRLLALGATAVRVIGHGAHTILFRIGGRSKKIDVPSHPPRPAAVVEKRCARAEALCARHARAVA